MDFEKLLDEMMLGKKYFTSRELMYKNDVNIHLSPYEYKQFLDYKDTGPFPLLEKAKLVKRLNLKTFNDYGMYYFLPSELVSLNLSYVNLLSEDIKERNTALSIRNMDEITLSRIYSEVEGTLNIEAVPTTRRAVIEIATGKRDPKTLNEQTIKNMIDGIEFVNKCPDFNENNLYQLYTILSKDCLDEEDELLAGNIYRHDGVEVGGYHGCPVNKIKECMDSLFIFVNDNKDNLDLYWYLPHIVHYYILYIHPYFDYNGRTARMVSYWISLLTNQKVTPPVISEAINQTKSEYYSAIAETRDAHNDLTYFLLYIYNISIKYFLTYKNIEEIDQNLKNKSIVLTSLDKAYFKKILISNKGKFTHSDFTKWVDVNMSKQGALKILNAFCEYGLLNSETTVSNKKIFETNPKVIKYTFSRKQTNREE